MKDIVFVTGVSVGLEMLRWAAGVSVAAAVGILIFTFCLGAIWGARNG